MIEIEQRIKINGELFCRDDMSYPNHNNGVTSIQLRRVGVADIREIYLKDKNLEIKDKIDKWLRYD